MSKIKKMLALFKWMLFNPLNFVISAAKGLYILKGFKYGESISITPSLPKESSSISNQLNGLKEYFDNHKAGNGIWKWNHYFEIYHKHFNKFINKEVHIVEVGIFSGGSMLMWKEYFGENCHVYGVDIEAKCKSYECDGIKIYIGDQSKREFWNYFKQEVPKVDIFIDDGGHMAFQQIPTLEEILPHIQPGGIYLCEDIHQSTNDFAHYIHGLQNGLNDWNFEHDDPLTIQSSPIQRCIKGIYNYPFVVVLEKNESEQSKLIAPKMGTSWEAFLN